MSHRISLRTRVAASTMLAVICLGGCPLTTEDDVGGSSPPQGTRPPTPPPPPPTPQQADLALTGLAASRGADLTSKTFEACSFTVVNNGPAALSSEGIMVEYYLSPNAIFADSDDRKIGDTGFTVSIASGGSYGIRLSSTGLMNMCREWPADLPAADYYLFARVSLVSPPPFDSTTSNNSSRTESTFLYNQIVTDQLLSESLDNFLDSDASAADAASDMEARFFAISAQSGLDAAITELDAALAAAVTNETDLTALMQRSTELGGRILDPEEAEQRGAIMDDARAKGITREAARQKLLQRSQQNGGPCPTSQFDSTVIFVNGIWTTYPSFIATVGRLDAVLQDAGVSRVQVIGVYNRSALDPQRSVFGRIICPVADWNVHGLLFPRVQSTICRQTGGRIIDLAEAVAQWEPFARFGSTPISGVGNAEEVRQAIIAAIETGRTVILIAHSQGNFFVRDAINDLGSDGQGRAYADSVAVIQVASPAQTMPGRTIRVDICEDRVPDVSLRKSPAGDCNECCIKSDVGSFPKSHYFVESYLSNSKARDRVVQAVRTFQSTLTNPRVDLGTGILQVTLSWDNSADVDLHVIEPTGSEVFYGNMGGDFGTLDRDDIDGFGPENYYICTEPEVGEGEYRIDIRHFSGASPANVTVRVKAGSSLRTFSGTVSWSSDIVGICTITYRNGRFSIR